MTEIRMTRNKQHYQLYVKNHAKTKMVCHAISSLVCCLAGALRNSDQVDRLITDMDYGDSHIDCYINGERAEEDFTAILIGFLQIQKNHPDEVKIEQNIFL